LGGFRDEHKENIMLVLSRKVLQEIIIADNIRLVVLEVRGDKVRLGIDAPAEIPVVREEIYGKGNYGDSGDSSPVA
jgi:carbon storage regulator